MPQVNPDSAQKVEGSQLWALSTSNEGGSAMAAAPAGGDADAVRLFLPTDTAPQRQDILHQRFPAALLALIVQCAHRAASFQHFDYGSNNMKSRHAPSGSDSEMSSAKGCS